MFYLILHYPRYKVKHFPPTTKFFANFLREVVICFYITYLSSTL